MPCGDTFSLLCHNIKSLSQEPGLIVYDFFYKTMSILTCHVLCSLWSWVRGLVQIVSWHIACLYCPVWLIALIQTMFPLHLEFVIVIWQSSTLIASGSLLISGSQPSQSETDVWPTLRLYHTLSYTTDLCWCPLIYSWTNACFGWSCFLVAKSFLFSRLSHPFEFQCKQKVMISAVNTFKIEMG